MGIRMINKMKKEEHRIIRAAVAELFKIGCCVATPSQILEIANKYELEAWFLESEYLEAVDQAAES